jgi:hypothetical protein
MLHRQAIKDLEKLKRAGLAAKAKQILETMAETLCDASALRKTDRRPFRSVFPAHQYSAPDRIHVDEEHRDTRGAHVDALRITRRHLAALERGRLFYAEKQEGGG